MKHRLPDWIVCPATKEALVQNEKTLTCADKTYPYLGKIPWLYKDPEYNFLVWGTKIEAYLKQEENYLSFMIHQANKTSNKLTKKRLTKIHEAKLKNLKVMNKLLTPFLGHQPIAIGQSTQQIYSYFQLIFRDWAWKGEEVQAYEEFVDAHLQEKDKKVLVLGAGACGLSYHLANKYPEKEIISVDHNPFLLFIAQKIFEGQEVKLSDYSFYPEDIELSAQQHKIKISKLENDNHHFILSSFPHLPFAFDTFDTIIAPWFFDILDTSFTESIQYILNFLNHDGQLLFYGPNNVHKPNMLHQLTPNEVRAEIENLFGEVTQNIQKLKYLESPLDAQQRTETVQFIVAQKPTESDEYYEPPQIDNKFRFDPRFEEYKAINGTFFHILKHITSDITAEELAPKLMQEFQFSPEESVHYARTFLEKIASDLK